MLKRAAPDLAKQIQATSEVEARKAEQRQIEWEAHLREREAEQVEEERKAEEERRRRVHDETRRDLLATIDAWALARRVEDFFADASRRAESLGSDSRTLLNSRIEHARQVLGTVDAFQRFSTWKSPEERYSALAVRNSGGTQTADRLTDREMP